ncbi:MAG: hypothetical protein ACPGO3_01335 [Magnetospiraceae bacterium]
MAEIRDGGPSESLEDLRLGIINLQHPKDIRPLRASLIRLEEAVKADQDRFNALESRFSDVWRALFLQSLRLGNTTEASMAIRQIRPATAQQQHRADLIDYFLAQGNYWGASDSLGYITDAKLRLELEPRVAALNPKNGAAAKAKVQAFEDSKKGYSVRVIDNFHRTDPEEQFDIAGFPTLEIAREYALRRVRASVEDQRKPKLPPEKIMAAWRALGEEVIVDGEYIGLNHLEAFVAQPATRAQCDYLALDPRRR